MDFRAPLTRQGEAQLAGNSGFFFQELQRSIGSFAALPVGEASSGHLLRYARLKLGALLLRTRALHLTASCLAEAVKCSLMEY